MKAPDKGNRPLLNERVGAIVHEVLENKGEDVLVLDVRGLSSLSDYFVIAHGRSTRHVQGMADNVLHNLRNKGMKCLGVEGEREGKWILMDYGDVVLHLFYGPVRGFYDLEGLWNQAPRVRVREDGTMETLL